MKVGNNFEVPKEYVGKLDVEYIDIGGYKVVRDLDKGVIVCGLREVNLFEQQVGKVSMLPLNTEAQGNIPNYPFEIENGCLVYQVSYC